MIDFDLALQTILEKALPPVAKSIVPLEKGLGATLAEEIRTAQDAPPFDRSMMDGFAMRSQGLSEAPVRLKLVGESSAGHPFHGKVKQGEAISILTGAVVPQGLDLVVPIEKANVGKDWVEVCGPFKSGQNIAQQGEDLKAGELILKPGTRIRPQELAVLAAVGKLKVKVFPSPKVAILATGDELVAVDRRPKHGQIRESNTYSLQAQCLRTLFRAKRFGIAPDKPIQMEKSIRRALDWGDCLLVSGGISVGRYDFVGQIFEKLRIKKHFHGVNIRPGKPVWFGTKGQKMVFGLPGNPVSSFVIFESLVRPGLEKMAGWSWQTRPRKAKFAGGQVKSMPRLQWLPALALDQESGVAVQALSWTSSGDFYELTRANALLKVPPDSLPQAGSVVEYLAI